MPPVAPFRQRQRRRTAPETDPSPSPRGGSCAAPAAGAWSVRGGTGEAIARCRSDVRRLIILGA